MSGMRPRCLSELLADVPLLGVTGSLQRDVASLAYDSRQAGEGSLFFAVPGLHHDGSQFVVDAVRHGARAFVTEAPLETLGAMNEGVTAVRVKDCRQAMAVISARFYGEPSRRLSVLGVTGTNGKTTVTYLLESILCAAGKSAGVLGTIGYRYAGRKLPAPMTTPEAPDLCRMMQEMITQNTPYCAMEVSSHSLALWRVGGIRFAVGVLTNLTRDHLDFHGSMENYRAAKKSFFTDYAMDARVVNVDDPLGSEIWREMRAGTLRTGIDSAADVVAEEVRLDERGSRFQLQTPWGRRAVASPLLGKHNVHNALSAAGAALQAGISLDAAAAGVEQLRLVPGRYERVDEGQNFIVAVDYAHTDDALANILGAARAFVRGRVILVFGCGGDRDRGKRPLMGQAALRGSDFAVITSDNPRTEDPARIIDDICAGITDASAERYAVEPERYAAVRLAISMAAAGDIVLIAGKGHEDYQILRGGKIHFDDREAAREVLRERLHRD